MPPETIVQFAFQFDFFYLITSFITTHFAMFSDLIEGTRRMRIAILHPSLTWRGGAERQVLNLAVELQRRKNEVEIFTAGVILNI